jgi:hypothetical protein
VKRTKFAWLALSTALFAAWPASAQSQKQCQPADIARLSGWSGVWLAEGMDSGINGRAIPGREDFGTYMKLAGLAAPWNDEGRKRFTEMLATVAGREQHGWGYPIMLSSPTPFEVIVGLSKTAFVGEYRDIRVVYTDGRAPDEDAWPTIYGESLGCWQGDTLEIKTTGVHYTPEFNGFAPPLSDNAVFVEHLRLTGPDTLGLDITVTDPETLANPWQTHVNYFRHKILQRLVIEGALEQNNRVVTVDGKYTITGAEGGLAEHGAAPVGESPPPKP